MNAAPQKHVEIFERDRGGVMGVKRAQRFQRRRAAAGIADPLEIGVNVDGVGRVRHKLAPNPATFRDATKRGPRPEGLYSLGKLSITFATRFSSLETKYGDLGDISSDCYWGCSVIDRGLRDSDRR